MMLATLPALYVVLLRAVSSRRILITSSLEAAHEAAVDAKAYHRLVRALHRRRPPALSPQETERKGSLPQTPDKLQERIRLHTFPD